VYLDAFGVVLESDVVPKFIEGPDHVAHMHMIPVGAVSDKINCFHNPYKPGQPRKAPQLD